MAIVMDMACRTQVPPAKPFLGENLKPLLEDDGAESCGTTCAGSDCSSLTSGSYSSLPDTGEDDGSDKVQDVEAVQLGAGGDKAMHAARLRAHAEMLKQQAAYFRAVAEQDSQQQVQIVSPPPPPELSPEEQVIQRRILGMVQKMRQQLQEMQQRQPLHPQQVQMLSQLKMLEQQPFIKKEQQAVVEQWQAYFAPFMAQQQQARSPAAWHGPAGQSGQMQMHRPAPAASLPTGRGGVRRPRCAGCAASEPDEIIGAQKIARINAMETSVMLQNIPVNYTRRKLLELINAEGFETCYDFLYFPVDCHRIENTCNFGYAVLNLVSNDEADRFSSHFSGFCGWGSSARKAGKTGWGEPLQPVDEVEPSVVFQRRRAAYPWPTRRLRVLR
jgi:hypothetical protein